MCYDSDSTFHFKGGRETMTPEEVEAVFGSDLTFVTVHRVPTRLCCVGTILIVDSLTYCGVEYHAYALFFSDRQFKIYS